MTSPERGALMLVRFLAVALIGWAVVETALYWVVCQHRQQTMEVAKLLVKILPLIVGIVLLVRAGAIAEWISDKLDL
jgi:hypothetical protein